MRVRFLLFIFIITKLSYSQEKYPESDFRSPLDIPLLLAGTFGELRSNHFHAGVDIKTQQREGLSVHAVGDGYISRIVVKHYGYGKALYIQHPNGYTTVYGHLKKFAPKIEAYIKERQYQQESYQIEVFPEATELELDKGEIIAYSGNTGGSQAPHLHFEVRDNAQRPINPMLFGIRVEDHQPPVIQGLYGYSMDNRSQINQSERQVRINLNRQADGSYLADKIYAEGNIGFGIATYDGQDETYNKNGIYSLEADVNGSPFFSYAFETFSFDESADINAFIDYAHLITHGLRIQKCFIRPASDLKIYKTNVNNGILNIQEGLSYTIEFRVKDFDNNLTIIRIPVEGKKQEILKTEDIRSTPDFLIASRDNIYQQGSSNIYFPAGCFYENLFLELSHDENSVTVHNNTVPLKRNYTLSMDAGKYSEQEQEKMFIANVGKNKRLFFQTTYKKGNIFSTRTKALGTFILAKDTIAPEVRPLNFKKDQQLTNFNYLKLRITDNLSGISDYRATIDGRWILTEYEYKNNTLTFDFDDIEFEGNKHELQVIVTDNVGNSTTFNTTFSRKK